MSRLFSFFLSPRLTSRFGGAHTRGNRRHNGTAAGTREDEAPPSPFYSQPSISHRTMEGEKGHRGGSARQITACPQRERSSSLVTRRAAAPGRPGPGPRGPGGPHGHIRAKHTHSYFARTEKKPTLMAGSMLFHSGVRSSVQTK